MNNIVCPLLLIPGKKGKNMIKVTKIIAIKNIKNTKVILLNLMIFMLKRKMFPKNMINKASVKVNCFNCGKHGHFSKDCNQKLGKLKNKFNMLNMDNKDQEELFKILELNI